jgi:hypothetical protein
MFWCNRWRCCASSLANNTPGHYHIKAAEDTSALNQYLIPARHYTTLVSSQRPHFVDVGAVDDGETVAMSEEEDKKVVTSGSNSKLHCSLTPALGKEHAQ